MKTKTFSEAIKVKDGMFYNLPFHIERLNRTSEHFYGKEIELNLTPDIIPEDMRKNIVKCRIEYADKILSVEFIPYSFRTINKVTIVHDNEIDYSFKSTDRSRLSTLLQASGCDEIIIVKNGFITDASSSNLVFENESGLYTPDTYLLRGTKREYLLRQGIIQEQTITVDNLSDYSKAYLINAMIDLEDNICFPVQSIL